MVHPLCPDGRLVAGAGVCTGSGGGDGERGLFLLYKEGFVGEGFIPPGDVYGIGGASGTPPLQQVTRIRPKPPSVLPRCPPARHYNKGYPYRDGNRLGTKCRPAQSRLWTGCRASSSGCWYSGGSARCCRWPWGSSRTPTSTRHFLPIQIRHHFLGRIPKIGNCHNFYIVIIQKHTRAQVELVRCIAAPDGDKSGGIFLKFRRIGMPSSYSSGMSIMPDGYMAIDGKVLVSPSSSQRVLRQRQTSHGSHFHPAVVPACSPGVPIGVVRVGGVQLAVYLGVHRQPAIV